MRNTGDEETTDLAAKVGSDSNEGLGAMKTIDVIGYNFEPMVLNAEKVMSFYQIIPNDASGGPLLGVMMETGEASEEWKLKEVLDVFRRKIESA